jgi:hypothetical protein
MPSDNLKHDSILSHVENGVISVPSMLESLIVRGAGSLLVRGEAGTRMTDPMVSELVRLCLEHDVCPRVVSLKFHSFGDNAVSHLCHLAQVYLYTSMLLRS